MEYICLFIFGSLDKSPNFRLCYSLILAFQNPKSRLSVFLLSLYTKELSSTHKALIAIETAVNTQVCLGSHFDSHIPSGTCIQQQTVQSHPVPFPTMTVSFRCYSSHKVLWNFPSLCMGRRVRLCFCSLVSLLWYSPYPVLSLNAAIPSHLSISSLFIMDILPGQLDFIHS